MILVRRDVGDVDDEGAASLFCCCCYFDAGGSFKSPPALVQNDVLDDLGTTGAAPFLGSLPSLVVGRRRRRRQRGGGGGHRSPCASAAATLTAFLWLVLARLDLARLA